MTTTTVHRIDIADLHTFRLQCRHCKHITIAEVKTWSSHGGRAVCMNCKTDWDDAGTALASLIAGLRTLCAARSPDVIIEAEVVHG